MLHLGLAAAVLLGSAQLTGCGQKGKLYLPDQPPPHGATAAGECRTPGCAAALSPAQAKPEQPEAGTEDHQEPDEANAEQPEHSAPTPKETPE
ncbi:LPS translocon maturation chaperone LptM [Ketobacter sp.]|uniref:LPS translocon maturation chaperone LptM n=1 Tax=Ketobacter sp. TaxID=2083498 RepID=UPI0025BA68B8|nr:lipoprotein [Ketobacter sp.]